MNNHPVIFIVLGGTGDLAMRKLFPAMLELQNNNLLPEFRVVSFARRPFTDTQFRALVNAETGIGDEKFLNKISYVQGNFDESQAYVRLGQQLGAIDQELGVCTHKLFHLSISPVFYEQVLLEMDKAGLAISCVQGDGVTRLLMEKPIGFNYESAVRVIAETERIFNTNQIFRIDHYLMKDHLFETLTEAPRPAKDHTTRVILNESLDIQGRGQFYDAVGALRDVAQNHALEMLSLVLSSDPHSPQKRAETLEQIAITQVSLGQYEGYLSEPGVNPNSTTETYFSLSGNQEGRLITLSGGKGLNKTDHSVSVNNAVYLLKKPDGELDAYSRMYLEAYQGKTERFVSKEEILASWKVIDRARSLAADSKPFNYPKGWTPKN